MPLGKPPSRAVLVLAALATQLIGAACIVAGLAALPVSHDLHRSVAVIGGWVLAALGALVMGGLAYRGRPVALALAAVIDAGFGYVLPRKDSALSALEALLPQGDVGLAESVIAAVAIGMFAAAALCLVAIPFAVRYRRWAASEDGVRGSREMRAVEPGTTARGMGAMGTVGGKPAPKTMMLRTSPLHPRSRAPVIALVAATVIVSGLCVVVALGRGGKPAAKPATGAPAAAAGGGGARGSGQVGSDGAGSVGGEGAGPGGAASSGVAGAVAGAGPLAGSGAAVQPVRADTPKHLADALHDALSAGQARMVELLLAPEAVALGPGSGDVASGSSAAAAQLASQGGAASASHALTGEDADARLAWWTEDLALGTHRYAASAVAIRTGDAWTLAAVDIAVPVANDTAFRLALAGTLPAPARVADHATGPADLVAAARAAFTSRDGFVAARSGRRDATNLGSAPGERMQGGEAIRRAFAGMSTVDMALRDGLDVRAIGDRAAISLGNVDFTAPDKDGAMVTQTFRVLAAWLRDDHGWHVVHSQFSNVQ